MVDAKIPLSAKTKIYVVAPPKIATGGPENLHQLAQNLRKLYPVDKVLMHYFGATDENPVPAAYAQFDVEFAKEVIEDTEENVLIIPEIYTRKFDEFTRINKVIWWMSVDNYYFSKSSLTDRARRMNSILFNHGIQHFFFFDKKVKEIKWHLANSHYVFEHFKKKGVGNIKYLIDYVSSDFAQNTVDETVKENIVAYNPKKGLAFTKKIMAASPDIKFVPIVNMNHEQMIDVLKRAKVYIDFGNHPGLDKMPREACILGCCVITGKYGSAKFFDDIPIPPDFKFSANWFTPPLVRKKILECFNDYHNQARKFIAYKERAKKDEQTHLNDIRHAFSFNEHA